MINTDLIRNILLLPKTFCEVKTVSMYELLKRTGYFEYYEQVSDRDLLKEIINCPEIVGDWISYSENKRTDVGNYIKQITESKYIVGQLCRPNNKIETIEFNCRDEACAAFIKMEIEEIRDR